MGSIEIIDGAMGSEFIKRGIQLPPHIWSAQLNLEKSELVKAVHEEYINAGANYITTNTFRTTPRAYKKLGLSNKEAEILANASLNNAIKIAQEVAFKKVKVLGSIAPLEDCYTPELFPGTKCAQKEFSQIAKWFYDKDIDIFLLETMNSIDEAQCCLEVINEYNIPIWISFVLLDNNHILSGEKLEDAINMVSSFNVDYFLINCNPLDKTEHALKVIANNWRKKWGIYPNLGIGEPSADGNIQNIYSDKEFINLIKKALNLNASVIGGCCGSNPNHIKLIKESI